jgi:hypothetical protein
VNGCVGWEVAMLGDTGAGNGKVECEVCVCGAEEKVECVGNHIQYL